VSVFDDNGLRALSHGADRCMHEASNIWLQPAFRHSLRAPLSALYLFTNAGQPRIDQTDISQCFYLFSSQFTLTFSQLHPSFVVHTATLIHSFRCQCHRCCLLIPSSHKHKHPRDLTLRLKRAISSTRTRKPSSHLNHYSRSCLHPCLLSKSR